MFFFQKGSKRYVGVSKNRGGFTPKMDGENNGKPYEQMDDLGVPLFLETPMRRNLRSNAEAGKQPTQVK